MPWFLSFLLLLLTISAFAQKSPYASIKGSVSTSDGMPAVSVTVQIKNTTKGTLTSEDGTFEFKKIKSGTYTLIFSLVGFENKEIQAQVKAAEEVHLNVQLEHTYAELQRVIVSSLSKTRYTETTPSPSLRLNMPLNEIPQNITITTGQLLSDQGLVTMSEAIRTVSGIQKNYGDLNDITLNFRGVEGFLNVYRNGLGEYWWNQQEDIAMVDNIEFIKGPASFIVSSFPPGGFINMVTKQPGRESVASVTAEYGSFNLFRLTTDWGGAFSKGSKFTYRFNAGLHEQDRAFQFSHASRYFLSGVLKYEVDKKNTITAEYNYMWGKTSGNNVNIPSSNGKLFSLPRNFAVADSKTDNLIVDDNYFRLLGTHQFNKNWSLNLLLGNIYGKWGHGYQLLADGNMPVTNDTLYRYAEYDNYHNYARIAQLYLNGSFHTGKNLEHKLFTAFDYHSHGVSDHWAATESKFGLYIPAPDYYVDPDSLKSSTYFGEDSVHSKGPSFYLEDHIKIRSKIILTLAGRFTHLEMKYKVGDILEYQKQTKYDQFTPRIGVTWLFSDAASAYLVYDQFFTPVFEKNIEHKPFKPMTGHNLEAGLKYSFLSNKLSTSLSAYKILTNNGLTPDPLHPGYYIQTTQYTNKGVEVDMAGNISPSLMINANYAYSDARVSKGDSNQIGKKKIGTPDHSANLWARYRLLNGKLKGLSFGLGYQYMGRRSALLLDDPFGNKYLPVYNLFDASIGYHNDKFNIGLNAYNITNIQYASNGYYNASTNEWRYTPGVPINFRLSVGVNLVSFRKDKIK